MKVTSLKLANVRAIEAAEFRFQPGFNLVAGVNGVGKTTLLDSLAVCFSAIVSHANRYSRYGSIFKADDIRVGAETLLAECNYECAGRRYGYRFLRFRYRSPLQNESQWLRTNEKKKDKMKLEQFDGGVPTDGKGGRPEGQLLAVLFTTKRAVSSRRAPGQRVAAGGTEAAFADAFANRELRLGEFAAWMKAQERKGTPINSDSILTARKWVSFYSRPFIAVLL